MSIDRILQMIMRIFLRKMVSKGINAGMRQVSKRAGGAPQGEKADLSPAERQQQREAKQAARKARQMARLARRGPKF